VAGTKSCMPSHTGKQVAAPRSALGGTRLPSLSQRRARWPRCSALRWFRSGCCGFCALLAATGLAHAAEVLVDGADGADGADNTDGVESTTPGRASGLGARRRGLWFGISGGVAVSPGERQRVLGLLELGLSLDAWLGSGALSSASEPEAGDDAPGQARAIDMDSSEAAAPALSAAVATTPGGAAGPRLLPRVALDRVGGRAPARPSSATPRSAASLLAAPASSLLASPIWPAGAPPAGSGVPAPLRGQPATARSLDPAFAAALARAAVNEALRIQGSGSELRRLDSMASRSRAAASLPEVRVGAGSSRDESQRLSPTLSDPAHFSRDGGRDLWMEARLTWRLDSAIFAKDEIAIMRLRAQQREGAAQLAREVLDALLDWQRARLLLASPLASAEERDAATVRHFGAVARLDIFTDGWFSRQLARFGGGAGGADP
jgi:hypothetical protein